MKHFNENMIIMEKRLKEAQEVKALIDALPYKLNEPVIFNTRAALVSGFEITHDKLNNKILNVLLVSVSDEAANHEGLVYKLVNIKVATDQVAPYTDAAKLLFKG